MDDNALRRPPRRNDPRTRTFPDGRVVKWCSKCSEWGDHLRADHPALPVERGNVGAKQGNVAVNANNLQVGAAVGDLAGHTTMEDAVDNATSGYSTGAFAQIRAAGLI